MIRLAEKSLSLLSLGRMPDVMIKTRQYTLLDQIKSSLQDYTKMWYTPENFKKVHQSERDKRGGC